MKKRIALTLLASLAPMSAYSTNIVINGTFDNTTTGWIGSYFAQNGPGGGFPSLSSQPYYWGGNNASNTITQVQDLPAGSLYTMSADLFGYSTQDDHSIFTVEFFDALSGAGSSLGSVSLSSLTGAPSAWASSHTAGSAPTFQSTSGTIPSSALSVLISLESIRKAGTANDGYADNLVFDVTAASVPDHGTTGVLLATSLLGLAFVRRKMRARE